jgi:hypothetical protein
MQFGIVCSAVQTAGVVACEDPVTLPDSLLNFRFGETDPRGYISSDSGNEDLN